MMPVVAWTPNSKSEIVPLVEIGVDGFITNDPGNVLQYLSEYVYAIRDSEDKYSVSAIVWAALGSAGTMLPWWFFLQRAFAHFFPSSQVPGLCWEVLRWPFGSTTA